MTFNHIDVCLPSLERETIDSVRYYSIPDNGELIKMVSITSITSHFNKEIFVKWRKKVGDVSSRGGLGSGCGFKGRLSHLSAMAC